MDRRISLLPFVLMFALAACTTPMPSIERLAGMDAGRAAAVLGLSNADIGFKVIDARTGEVLAARNANRVFPSASTVKLPTMVAALGILGPDFRFRTRILARGTLKDGILSGDLTLAGDGDPLLNGGDLRALSVRLADIGVERVDGRFIVDRSLPAFPLINPDQPETAPYNQGIAGLNFTFNRVMRMPTEGGTAVVPPEAADLVPDNAGPAPSEVPVRRPAMLAARMLHRFAEAEGVRLPPPAAGEAPEGAVIVAEIRSQPLIEIVRAGLEYSNNLIAETVGLAAARATGAPVETLADSARVVGLWLEREVPGLHGFASNLVNHSGLSVDSRMSPENMTTLLAFALNHRFDGWRIDALLPPGGVRDNFNGRFKDPATAYRVWAKSGTMRYIKGLAGYLDAKSGRRLIFAVHVHDPDARGKLEINPARFGEEARQKSEYWRQRAELLESSLITRWISSY